jgi:hypothetical protein
MKCEWMFYMPVHVETGSIDMQWLGEALQYPEDEALLEDDYYRLASGWEWRPIEVTFKEMKNAKK